MARIQILQLPPCGRDGEQPFALIVDQCETPPQRVVTGLPTDASDTLAFMPLRRADITPPVEFTDPWQEFGKQIGASGVMVTREWVEVVDGTDDPDGALVEFDHAALMESVKTAVRAHLESAEASAAFRADTERRP